ncbi:MAG: hypothetical protein BWZ04_01015 [Firmicutes bacterium ADurb.BinA205]|nr:MAG: hypothetical protein BWZ04_01015 [Firmicutes bacterium ADurb.BinA205]
MCTSSYISAYAVEAPSGIEVEIGTVELNKEDLHGDTVVDVPVYIRNNPGFLALALVYELNPWLSYDGDEIESDLHEVSDISIYRCRGTDKIMSADIMTRGSSKVQGDCEVAHLRVVVPGNLDVGSYYIRFANGYDNEFFSILVEDSLDACFGPECFSRCDEGAVIIKNADSPAPPPPPPPPQQQNVQEPQVQNNDPAPQQNVQQNTAENSLPSDASAEQTTTSGTTGTTSAASKTTKTTSSTAKTTAETASETTETESSTSVVQTSTVAVTTEVKKQNDKRENHNILAAAIASAAAVAAIAAGLIIKKKRDNSHE